MDGIGIGIGSPGGRGYRAPYGANNKVIWDTFAMWHLVCKAFRGPNAPEALEIKKAVAGSPSSRGEKWLS